MFQVVVGVVIEETSADDSSAQGGAYLALRWTVGVITIYPHIHSRHISGQRIINQPNILHMHGYRVCLTIIMFYRGLLVFLIY